MMYCFAVLCFVCVVLRFLGEGKIVKPCGMVFSCCLCSDAADCMLEGMMVTMHDTAKCYVLAGCVYVIAVGGYIMLVMLWGSL